MNSALGQLVHLRKSNSMSGHVPVLFMCCEYHFLDTIMNFLDLFLIFKFQPHHHGPGNCRRIVQCHLGPGLVS